MKKNQKIRTKFNYVSLAVKNGNITPRDIQLTGWLEKSPFLRIADENNQALAVLRGAQLYRLAKAIVSRFEAAHD